MNVPHPIHQAVRSCLLRREHVSLRGIGVLALRPEPARRNGSRWSSPSASILHLPGRGQTDDAVILEVARRTNASVSEARSTVRRFEDAVLRELSGRGHVEWNDLGRFRSGPDGGLRFTPTARPMTPPAAFGLGDLTVPRIVREVDFDIPNTARPIDPSPSGTEDDAGTTRHATWPNQILRVAALLIAVLGAALVAIDPPHLALDGDGGQVASIGSIDTPTNDLLAYAPQRTDLVRDKQLIAHREAVTPDALETVSPMWRQRFETAHVAEVASAEPGYYLIISSLSTRDAAERLVRDEPGAVLLPSDGRYRVGMSMDADDDWASRISAITADHDGAWVLRVAPSSPSSQSPAGEVDDASGKKKGR